VTPADKLPGAAPPAPVRVRLRYAAFETFIEKFAPNVTRGGVFLASRNPRPVGEIFAFEVLLEGGEVALAGEGKVTWVKAFDPAIPNRAHGMGVQFLRLDAPSRDALNRMLARKASGNSGVVRASTSISGGASGGHRSGSNGALPAVPRVDTNVDLAAEMGIDETRMRRAVDRNWLGSNRASGEIDDLEALRLLQNARIARQQHPDVAGSRERARQRGRRGCWRGSARAGVRRGRRASRTSRDLRPSSCQCPAR